MTRDQILAAHERGLIKEVWKKANAFADSYYFLKKCIKENARMGNTVLTFNLLSYGDKLNAICACRLTSMKFDRLGDGELTIYRFSHRTGDTKITRTRDQIEIDLLHYVK